MVELDSPLVEVDGVGSRVANQLERLGLLTVQDVLLNLPVSWEIFGEVSLIKSLHVGQSVQLEGTLLDIQSRQLPGKKLNLTTGKFSDGTNRHISLVWFNKPWLVNSLQIGDKLVVAGTVGLTRTGLTINNPHFEKLDGGDISLEHAPRYRLTQGMTSRRLSQLAKKLIFLAPQLTDSLPLEIETEQGLITLPEAIRMGHMPKSMEEFARARQRLAFVNLFELQIALILDERARAGELSPSIPFQKEVVESFKKSLGFSLTHAQRVATWAVFQDLEKERPMSRLLNGDVGSGKTAVCAAAIAMVYVAGFQSAVLAPTEILARQHLFKFRQYLESACPGIKIELLVSNLSSSEKKRILERLAKGKIDLIIGTHALLEDRVKIPNLAFACVDEQHRFGTFQREALRGKGNLRPHFLAMTATPIPRTLALALYGGMDFSVLDEMPPGRSPAKTLMFGEEEREKAYELIRQEIVLGHQVFVVCPRIDEVVVEEGEENARSIRAAKVEAERLESEVFPNLRVGLVHGRMKDKDRVMEHFRAGDLDILVATSVVEVGVDIPNATIMLIEGADGFGLAQLHQLRGRIGRGAAQSYCLLFSETENEKALERLNLLCSSNDGFVLAEADLRLRGVGEFFGSRQHGMADLAMEVVMNPDLLRSARIAAQKYLALDPDLSQNPVLRAKSDIFLSLRSTS